MKITAAADGAPNYGRLCVKGRFAYDFIVMFAPSLKRTEIEEAVFAKA